MRFAHHLSSHLTPEWRKHYIDYDELKERIYEMVGKKVVRGDEDIGKYKQVKVLGMVQCHLILNKGSED